MSLLASLGHSLYVGSGEESMTCGRDMDVVVKMNDPTTMVRARDIYSLIVMLSRRGADMASGLYLPIKREGFTSLRFSRRIILELFGEQPPPRV